MPATSMTAAPLLSGDITTGALGFVKFGDREWTAEELNAVEAIASLFAQLQARINAEEQLRYLAEHDDLTGMHNRRALLAHLDARLQPGRPGPVALLFLDLDRLKAINDFLGHTAGDQFIEAVAERLAAKMGDSSLIARLGGDEFVVVPASPMNIARAESLARELHAALSDRVDIDGEADHPHRQRRGGAGRPRCRHDVGLDCGAPTRRCCRRRTLAATTSRCSPRKCRSEAHSATTSNCTCRT